MELVTSILFPSRARRSLLVALFRDGAADISVSELARRAGLTPRAVAIEVARLDAAGLVRVEAIGPAHLVRPRLEHPAVGPLRALLGANPFPPSDEEEAEVRRSLATYGAPFAGDAAAAPLPLTETLLRGLSLARADATVLLVLPAVLALRAGDVDFRELKEGARRLKLKAELGFLLDLTADVAGLPALRERASDLADGRRRLQRHLPTSLGAREKELAESRSPAAAGRWNFRVNMTEEAFRAALREGAALSRGDLVGFLRAVDGELREIVEVTASGGTAIALQFSSHHATARLALVPMGGPGLPEALERARRHYPGIAEPHLAAPARAPGEWRARVLALPSLDLPRLRIFVPERHDLALMGLASGLTRDLQAAEDIHRAHPLRLGVLLARYFEVEDGGVPSPRDFRLAFLALLERLFGLDVADRTAATLGGRTEKGS